eukprot:TRINITY_DN9287_c0_g1_i1.p1 TRINITY_DN9287_c0_g1~~TRINITY_DN9287_c0_g1_i1.p1  ORF type:complete len:178 (-),score=66.96 TRINITY_DN9287_c0_g1_i1:3-536(-)
MSLKRKAQEIEEENGEILKSSNFLPKENKERNCILLKGVVKKERLFYYEGNAMESRISFERRTIRYIPIVSPIFYVNGGKLRVASPLDEDVFRFSSEDTFNQFESPGKCFGTEDYRSVGEKFEKGLQMARENMGEMDRIMPREAFNKFYQSSRWRLEYLRYKRQRIEKPRALKRREE